MQLTLGRRWVLELRVSVAVRDRVDEACTLVRSCVHRDLSRRDRELRWERDKVVGMMSSGWDSTMNRECRRQGRD